MAGGLGRDEWLSAGTFARFATLATTRGISAARLTPWKFDTSPENIQAPKGKDRLPSIIFQGIWDMLNFECSLQDSGSNYCNLWRWSLMTSQGWVSTNQGTMVCIYSYLWKLWVRADVAWFLLPLVLNNDGISPATFWFCSAMLTMLSMLISVISLALFRETWILTYVGPVFAHGALIYSYHPFAAFTQRLGTMLNVHRVNHGLHLPFASRSVPRVFGSRQLFRMNSCQKGLKQLHGWWVQDSTSMYKKINRWFMGHESFRQGLREARLLSIVLWYHR